MITICWTIAGASGYTAFVLLAAGFCGFNNRKRPRYLDRAPD